MTEAYMILNVPSNKAQHYPFESQRRVFSTFDQNFDFKTKRDHKKNFL